MKNQNDNQTSMFSFVPPALGTFEPSNKNANEYEKLIEWHQEAKKHQLPAQLPLFGERNAQDYKQRVIMHSQAILEVYGTNTRVQSWDGPCAINCYKPFTYKETRESFQAYFTRFKILKEVCESMKLMLDHINVQAVSNADHISVIINAAKAANTEIRISLYTYTKNNTECIWLNGEWIPVEKVITRYAPSYGFGVNCIGYDQIDRIIDQLTSAGCVEKLQEILPNASGVPGHLMDQANTVGGHTHVHTCECIHTVIQWVQTTQKKVPNLRHIGLCCGSTFDQIKALQKAIPCHVKAA